MKQYFIIMIALLLPAMVWGQNNVPTSTSVPTVTNHVVLPQQYSAPYWNGLLNFTRTWRPILPQTDATTDMFTLQPSSLLAYLCGVTTTYTNGWGQPIETIKRGGDRIDNSDIVQPYDIRTSLTSTTFLPYAPGASGTTFDSDPFDASVGYTHMNYASEGTSGFSQSVSSMGTVHGVINPTTASYSPGVSFVGQAAGTVEQTTFNDGVQELVPILTYDDNLGLENSGNYGYGALTVKTTTMQNSAVTKEYYDKNNRLVCKRAYNSSGSGNVNVNYLTTFYVYDVVGRLREIIPPANAATFPTQNGALNFYYTYNSYGQLATKSVPGQASGQYTVYDRKQRAVLFAQPLAYNENKYQFTIYDDLDRVVAQGYLNDPARAGYPQFQAWLSDTLNAPPVSTYPLLGYLYYDTGVNNITTIANCEIDVLNYYDQLPSFAAGATFDNSFSGDYQPGGGVAVTPVPSGVTKGLMVASKILVRDSGNSNIPNKWITNTFFYDQWGQLIQTQTLNPWNTTHKDVITTQYDFQHNKIGDIVQYYDTAGSNKPSTKMVVNYTRDNYNDARPTNTKLSFDNTGWHNINSFTYDDLGRVQTKMLGGVEKQFYNYNVRGQLAGINSSYVTTGINVDSNMSFGCVLDYDQGFTLPRTDGKIAGMIWRGAGNSAVEMAYGYHYDPTGRLTEADFNELSGGWLHTAMDYSMPYATYDANGNLLTMEQMATPSPGHTAAMDQLTYTYQNNQVSKVTDAIHNNYNLGDFLNGTCTSCNKQYFYDQDGNLAADTNKHIQNIIYNEGDQPTLVKFANGNTIKNIYAGNGALLRKTVSDNVNHIIKDYRYWGPFVYMNDTLQYVLHDEGRARYLADTQSFRFDYFVKDHLGNVRNVVTAEQYSYNPIYTATNELEYSGAENLVFNNIDSIRTDNGLQTGENSSYKAVTLDGSDPSKIIGTSILLHGMAGDKIDISSQTYWEPSDQEKIYDDGSALISALFSTLAGGTRGASVTPDAQAAYATSVDNTLTANADVFQGLMDNATDPNTPRAYINYLVFDENMNLVPEQSGAIQVGSIPNAWQTVGVQQPVTLGQNGYIAVYMSNAQQQAVSMDNMTVTVYKGRLVQAQNYYPFGLAINEGASSTTPANKFLYQGKEYGDQLGFDLYDFVARQYDPQIGRFWGVDPASQYPSGYTGMGNDPGNKIDPSGMLASGAINTAYGSPGSGLGGRNTNTDGGGYVNPMDESQPSIVGVIADIDGNIGMFASAEDAKEYQTNYYANKAMMQNNLLGQMMGRVNPSLPNYTFTRSFNNYSASGNYPTLACVGGGCNVPTANTTNPNGIAHVADATADISNLYLYSTTIPTMTASFITDTKYGQWVSAGGFTYSSATFGAQRSLLMEAQATGNMLGAVGRTAGWVGAGLTLGADATGVYNYYNAGANAPGAVSLGHMAADGAASVIGISGGFFGAGLSALYFYTSPVIWSSGNPQPAIAPPVNDNTYVAPPTINH